MFVKYTSIFGLVIFVACASQEPKVQNEKTQTWADQGIVAASGDLAHGSQEGKEAQQAGDKALGVLGTQEDKANSEEHLVAEKEQVDNGDALIAAERQSWVEEGLVPEQNYEENVSNEESAAWENEADYVIAQVASWAQAPVQSAEETSVDASLEASGTEQAASGESFSIEETIQRAPAYAGPGNSDSCTDSCSATLAEELRRDDNPNSNNQSAGLTTWWDTVMAIGIDETPDAWQGQLNENEFWRSSLYPKGWQPGYKIYSVQGQKELFLQDYSYAGYNQGHQSLPVPQANDSIFDVTTYGADASGNNDSWAAVQKAIIAAEQANHGVVYFPAGHYLIEGSASALDDLKDELNLQPNPPSSTRLNALDHGILRVADSYVTLRGAGEHQSHLYFPRSQGMSDWNRQAHILFEPLGTWGHGASSHAALILDAQVFDTSVIVDTLGALAVGQDIVLGAEISAAFRAEFNITSEWSSANGQWMPFFHRKITSVQSLSRGYRIEFDVPLRYALKTRDNASLRIQSNLLNKVGIESLAVSNAVSRDAAWKVDPEVAMSSTSLMAHVHLLEMNGVKNGFMHKIKSFEPSTFGFSYQSGKHLQSGGLDIANSKNVTVAEVTMKNAQNRGPDGNGYLFKVGRSNEILVRDSVGQSGRHNFAVNNHFGTSGCVFLRIYSSGANKYQWFAGGPVWTSAGNSDFHKALSAANLVDSSTLDDGWSAKYYVNGFPHYNPNAGHTSFQNVFWNNGGSGTVVSHQFHYGYNIGARGSLRTDLNGQSQTSPQDFFEGGRNLMVGQDMDRNIGEKLFPSSLYEHQLVRRKGGYPGTSPAVAGPQSTGCPWGMDLEGFYLNGTPICKSVVATAVRICKCVKEDAFIYGSQCLFNENGHYRARELKSGSCNACPFGMTKIGEHQGKNVCKPLITTPVSEVTCIDTNGVVGPSGFSNKCLWYRSYNAYNGYYKARGLNGNICPLLQVHLGSHNGKPVCHDVTSIQISQITCVNNGDDVWSTSANDWCVHAEGSNGTTNWYKARSANYVCPNLRPYLGTHNGKPVCQRLPNIEISQVTCANNGDTVWNNGNSSWCVDGAVMSGGAVNWYKARSANNVCPNLRPHLGTHSSGKPICQALPNIAMSYAACFSGNNGTWVSPGNSNWCLLPQTGWYKARSLGDKCPGVGGISLMTYKGMKNGLPACKYNPTWYITQNQCSNNGGVWWNGGCAEPRSGWWKWRPKYPW